jgi:hypothetical protein
MKPIRCFLLNTAILGAMSVPMLLVPSYGQQEIDPTWHDPWAVTTPAAAQSAPIPAKAQAKNLPAKERSKKQVRKQPANAQPQNLAAKLVR